MEGLDKKLADDSSLKPLLQLVNLVSACQTRSGLSGGYGVPVENFEIRRLGGQAADPSPSTSLRVRMTRSMVSVSAAQAGIG